MLCNDGDDECDGNGMVGRCNVVRSNGGIYAERRNSCGKDDDENNYGQNRTNVTLSHKETRGRRDQHMMVGTAAPTAPSQEQTRSKDDTQGGGHLGSAMDQGGTQDGGATITQDSIVLDGNEMSCSDGDGNEMSCSDGDGNEMSCSDGDGKDGDYDDEDNDGQNRTNASLLPATNEAAAAGVDQVEQGTMDG